MRKTTLAAGALTLAAAAAAVAPLGASAPASAATAPTVAVNVGGGALTTAGGVQYAADQGFTGGRASTAAPTTPADAEVYRTLRYGMTAYDLSVPNGQYDVTLEMVENYWSAAGKRRFDVSLEGSRVLRSFDVFAAAGGKNRGLDKTFTTTVRDGRIDIDFKKVVDKPSVAGIVVTPAGSSEPAPTPAPTPAPSPAPSPTTPPASSGAVTVLAAGDVAKVGGAQAKTADLIGKVDPAALLMLGDAQYNSGSKAEFTASGAYVSTWGRYVSKTMPIAGNHEWETPGAAGYRSVFDSVTGGRWWHSRDVGAWHVIGLDSNCTNVGGCGPTSEQVKWLKADLAANDGEPTIVMWHHPRWSSGEHLDNPSVNTLWSTSVADRDVQIVLWGHDHNYERFSPTDAAEKASATGARAFVVGTGGAPLRGGATAERDPHSALFSSSSHGLLQLVLRPTSYDWKFLRVDGSLTDEGTAGLRP